MTYLVQTKMNFQADQMLESVFKTEWVGDRATPHLQPMFLSPQTSMKRRLNNFSCAFTGSTVLKRKEVLLPMTTR